MRKTFSAGMIYVFRKSSLSEVYHPKYQSVLQICYSDYFINESKLIINYV